MRIEIEAIGIERVDAGLRELAGRLVNLTPFWNDYALSLVEGMFKDIFGSEGFGNWAPLDTEYAKQKEAEFPGRGILVRTGAYRGALTSNLHPGNIFETTPTEMTFGASGDWFQSRFGAPYPFFHEGGHGVPQRQTAGLIVDATMFRREIGKILERYAAESVRESGLAS